MAVDMDNLSAYEQKCYEKKLTRDGKSNPNKLSSFSTNEQRVESIILILEEAKEFLTDTELQTRSTFGDGVFYTTMKKAKQIYPKYLLRDKKRMGYELKK